MKFAKELERDAVPEWRIKYLNYKAGKKYVKAVARAASRANNTPRSFGQRPPSYYPLPTDQSGLQESRSGEPDSSIRHVPSTTSPRPVAMARSREDESLTRDGNTLQYGSFVPTPPRGMSPLAHEESRTRFELPGPALRTPSEHAESSKPTDTLKRFLTPHGMERRASMASVPTSSKDSVPISQTLPNLPKAGVLAPSPHSQLRRIFSYSPGQGMMRDSTKGVMGMQNFDLIRERESEFYEFMDSELDKVDSFYKMKEEQAGQRLSVLREQLHEMRNRRIQEMDEELRPEAHVPHEGPHDHNHDKSNGWAHPFKTKIFPPGPNSKALHNMPRTPHMSGFRLGDAGRDYSRRPEDQDVSYRTAKRKLKLAMQEFYRGLELLKSYALMNRTAFRKINKKFDKAANARPPFRYMNEKVNKAWFVNSEALDGHITTVEDLYSRYFERGNRKLAVGKLRSLARKATDESGSSFLNGILIGTGAVFTIQGVIYGSQLLFHEDPQLRQRTSYLMQLYGGYFLMLVLFSYFCIDCFIWTKNKINYPFIFEFDRRSHMDWRRLAAFPSFFLLLFGVIMWTNFSRYGADWMYLYYPVVLVGVTAFIILLPAPVLAHKSRKWFAYSHWRLLLAGFYPVEFRDFFLGDIYCSLTYATANVELFFCLYGHAWNNPVQCNSNNSRALGFLTTLPPIWRLLQCLRRYKDTRNIFPHLINGGKYMMTILSAVTLSLYRINGTHTNLALFITFSLINSFYTSVWDLFMDFSLLQTHSRHFILRDVLALKKRWPYYFIMIVDPILRFAWIFYAIFTHDTQHSTVTSFLVSLTEVTRRGMWALFRVENEHCANVSQYKASRDVPLPYRIEPLMTRASAESSPVLTDEEQQQRRQQQLLEAQQQQQRQDQGQSTATSTGVSNTLSNLRKRADTTIARSFSKILADAHKQDFEKKRKPADQTVEEEEAREEMSDDDYGEEDDDDEDESRNLVDVREAEQLRRRSRDDV